ncbi:hypothetical protein LJC51_07535 [Lachnospiraceae bacterium OttesenSCG-928-J05]|nr:hypothetical protein [Lachnospiraceae bacterium OttesenSCG-928-J05]
MLEIYEELLASPVIKVECQAFDYELHFYLENGKHYKFFHDPVSDESALITDITGNLDDLRGQLIIAELVDNYDEMDSYGDIFEWTFYKFATAKGYVTVRWEGHGTTWYSTSVELVEVIDNK